MAGYHDSVYARALSEWGDPVLLPNADGWLLRRSVGDTGLSDLTGCYPLFCCRYWRRLGADLDNLAREAVSLTLVADPWGGYDVDLLRRLFPDLCKPYKTHFTTDLSLDLASVVRSGHRGKARKALEELEVRVVRSSADTLFTWIRLYRHLCSRHGIQGVQAFSEASFAIQFDAPGLVALEARKSDQVVGMVLWFLKDDIAYYHLGAWDETGYNACASFGLFWQSMHLFREMGLRWLHLGGGAGIEADASDGLTRFKSGWASGTRQAYLCGRIFDHDAYRSLSAHVKNDGPRYFPAYRSVAGLSAVASDAIRESPFAPL